MAGIQLSGLASGLDWNTVVNQLMTASQVPQNSLRTQQSAVNQQSSALTDLKSLLTSLQTSQRALQTSGVFARRSVTAADADSTWKATAADGATTGTCQVAVTKLATAAKLAGVSGQTDSLCATSNVSGNVISALKLGTPITAGNFSINGTQISVATTDTLGDVFARISTQTGGAVTASYDPATDAVKLQGAGALTLGSGSDTSNFLQALKLYSGGATVTSSSRLATLRQGWPLAQASLKQPITAVDGSGNGSFSINGVSIAYNVNTDSLQDVMKRIAASGAGATVSYQAGQDQFTLSNSATGNVGLFTNEAAGGFLAALGLGSGATAQAGENAEYSVNGGATEFSKSNTLDAQALGVTGLSITATTTGTQTFTVGAQLTDAQKNLEEFVSKFNAVESFIAEKTKVTVSGAKVTTGVLYGNTEVRELGRSLRSMIFQATSGASGNLTRLADLGLDFSGTTSTLSIKDPTALASALATPQVSELFASGSSSSMGQLGALLDRTIGSSGSLPAAVTRLGKRSQGYDAQIATMQRHLDAQKKALQNSFIQMESAQASLQQQAKALTNMFGSSTSG